MQGMTEVKVEEGGSKVSVTTKTNRSVNSPLKEKKSLGGKNGIPVPEILKFTSWWDEDREESSLGNGSSAGGGLKRRYVSLMFYTASGTFDVRK